MTTNFYNKVAKKFGSYHSGVTYKQEFPEKDPEKVFKKKLLSVSGKDKTALDLGCADGRFTFSIAPHFKKIVGIDLSSGMLTAAKKLQKKQKITNVVFEKQNAEHTTFNGESFEVVWSRRGPTPLAEAYRILKSNGYYIEIDIGEQDARCLKEVFKRGQGHGKWNTSRKDKVNKKALGLKFSIVFSKDYHYTEYYASYDDVDLFLQGVPIFENFDSEKDKQILQKYVKTHTNKKGILLNRHRVVTVLKKR